MAPKIIRARAGVFLASLSLVATPFHISSSVTVDHPPRVDDDLSLRSSEGSLFSVPHAHTLGPLTYTAPAEFPSELFDEYYNDPHNLSVQPQPIIYDPISGTPYELTLTSPQTIADVNLVDPIVLPPIHKTGNEASNLAIETFRQILASFINLKTSCARCQSLLTHLGQLGKQAPQTVPGLFVRICLLLKLLTPASACEKSFGLRGFGPTISQVLPYAQTDGYDGQYICYSFLKMCPLPDPIPFKLEDYLPKSRPQIKHFPKKRSPNGRRLKVLHLSDFHIDPRYAIGSEANCTGPSVCCRLPPLLVNSTSAPVGPPTLPAPRFGDYLCDTPLALAAATLQAIPVLLRGDEDGGTGIDFTIFTGDLVSHDLDYQLSRDYVTYTETLVFDMLKRTLGNGPVYAALGNHDNYANAQGTPNLGLPQNIKEQFSWNYDNVARLWSRNGWLPQDVAEESKAHYGAYAVERRDGLKIISINTEMWYSKNLLNYINMTNPDTSGMLRFMARELQASELKGERVWIIGHVIPGDRDEGLLNPTGLFYQIVERYSPHVIAAIFFGHSHQDEFQIYYSQNGVKFTTESAVAVSWIGPSVTPLTNYNGGFRMYEVDPDTFEILDAHTWYSDVSTYSNLSDTGPMFQYEYSTREAYGAAVPGWSWDAPLNATWWHRVTERMLLDGGELIGRYNQYLGRHSNKLLTCNTQECALTTVCKMRSASASLAVKNCTLGSIPSLPKKGD